MWYLFILILSLLYWDVNANVCTNATFPRILDGMQCWGLERGKAKSALTCAQECCDLANCSTWQWCDDADTCHVEKQMDGCWRGNPTDCKSVSGWVGRGGRQLSLIIQLPGKIPNPTPLPRMGNDTDPQNNNVTVDSVSYKYNGRRWLPIAGEFQPTRITASEWREQLLRMQAGGLDMVSVYIVWNHHEELEGQWNFTGRCNLRKFMQTVHEVGLKVLLRIGPWDHGEIRNGGHPDWLLKKAKSSHFKLRNNNTQYLNYVGLYYQKLGLQFKGLFF